MNTEKQIEQMEIDFREAIAEYDKVWHKCFHNNGKKPDRETVFYAKYLVENKGYHKASEVAAEIFAEIEKIIEVDKDGVATLDIRELYKLKKKYTEGDNNG